jgi:IS5 family transposase
MYYCKESLKREEKPCNMKPWKKPEGLIQSEMFKVFLKDIVFDRHPLVSLADMVEWAVFEEKLTPTFCDDNGRPGLPVRLMVGLHYLKYTYGLSDEAVVEGWIENPYWQYFCGGIFFEHELPIDPSSMTRWRERLHGAGLEELLGETIRTGLRGGFIRERDLKRVNVDTTVQEKNVRFPTDARLYDRMRERLVEAARDRGIELRQTYARKGKKALLRQSGYARAQQFKRARGQTRTLKTYLGRVVRDIERKAGTLDDGLRELLGLSRRLLVQERHDKDKLYSVHEPHVDCISKGKIHKRYEFGCKVGVATTAKENWVVASLAFHGNPYDGHTLKQTLDQVERVTNLAPHQAVCDLGYRGNNYEGDCRVLIVNRYRKSVPTSIKKWLKRRSAVEPVIGHLKHEHRMERNTLKGKAGDFMNALLSACGYNIRKLLRAIARFFALIFTLLFPALNRSALQSAA